MADHNTSNDARLLLRNSVHELLSEEERALLKHIIRMYRQQGSLSMLCAALSKVITKEEHLKLLPLMSDTFPEETRAKFLQECENQIPVYSMHRKRLLSVNLSPLSFVRSTSLCGFPNSNGRKASTYQATTPNKGFPDCNVTISHPIQHLEHTNEYGSQTFLCNMNIEENILRRSGRRATSTTTAFRFEERKLSDRVLLSPSECSIGFNKVHFPKHLNDSLLSPGNSNQLTLLTPMFSLSSSKSCHKSSPHLFDCQKLINCTQCAQFTTNESPLNCLSHLYHMRSSNEESWNSNSENPESQSKSANPARRLRLHYRYENPQTKNFSVMKSSSQTSFNDCVPFGGQNNISECLETVFIEVRDFSQQTKTEVAEISTQTD